MLANSCGVRNTVCITLPPWGIILESNPGVSSIVLWKCHIGVSIQTWEKMPINKNPNTKFYHSVCSTRDASYVTIYAYVAVHN